MGTGLEKESYVYIFILYIFFFFLSALGQPQIGNVQTAAESATQPTRNPPHTLYGLISHGNLLVSHMFYPQKLANVWAT
jgi:hypothetical protein